MGHSNRKIADCLGCNDSTVERRLGPLAARPDLSAADLVDLFERYDTQRNIEEIITATSGSPQQARLRTSLRARISKHNGALGDEPEPMNEELSDEQLRRAVEALVGES